MQLKKTLLYAVSLLSFNYATAQNHYGKNVLAIAPIQMSEKGVGFGLSYEHDLDKKGIASFYMPASFVSAADNSYYMYSYYNPEMSRRRYRTAYIMPGIKFYPTGNKGKVKYSVGPHLVAAFGQTPSYDYHTMIYPGPTPVYTLKNRFALGTMVFNSLNVNATEHLYIGTELGMGVTYLEQVDGMNTGEMPFLVQFSVKMGYRF